MRLGCNISYMVVQVRGDNCEERGSVWLSVNNVSGERTHLRRKQSQKSKRSITCIWNFLYEQEAYVSSMENTDIGRGRRALLCMLSAHDHRWGRWGAAPHSYQGLTRCESEIIVVTELLTLRGEKGWHKQRRVAAATAAGQTSTSAFGQELTKVSCELCNHSCLTLKTLQSFIFG